MTYCTTCKNLKIVEVQFRKDGTAPTRQGNCTKYNCTLQLTDKTFARGSKCREGNGFESV